MNTQEIYNVLYTLKKSCRGKEEQTIVEIPQNMLVDAIISIVVNIMNRCSMKSVKNNVPQEAWIGMKRILFHLIFFCYIAYAHIPDELRKKLDNKGDFVFWDTQKIQMNINYVILSQRNLLSIVMFSLWKMKHRMEV